MLREDQLRDVLSTTCTIAIVGAKDKAGQAVDSVGRYLINAGYTVIPIHPTHKNVWGLTTYATLADVPVPIDIVDVFRAPEYCAAHAREAAALAACPKVFWMQLGISDDEAARLAKEAGMGVIDNSCIKIVHHRLFG